MCVVEEYGFYSNLPILGRVLVSQTVRRIDHTKCDQPYSAAAPLTNSGGVLADIWDTDHRGQAMSIFSLAPFAGPSIGPIVAGFIETSGTVSLHL
jgi:MFS family permease